MKKFRLITGIVFLLFSNLLYAESPPLTKSNDSTNKTTKYYFLKGNLSGLIGTVVLQINLPDSHSSNIQSMSTDGNFSFTKPISDGSKYNVSVQIPPSGQICTVNNAEGIINGSDITNLIVTCSSTAHRIGGIISGLASSITLQLNNAYTTTINNNGTFTLPTEIAYHGAYTVNILKNPINQTCSIRNGSGVMGDTSVNNVIITCASSAHTIGGTISGLKANVILQNNKTDLLQVSADGNFTFPTPIAEGSHYLVTVKSQPQGQVCIVNNNSGIINNSDITNITITCQANSTTISVEPQGIIPVNGGSVSLKITNTGTTFFAENVSAILPSGWTQVSEDARDCISIQPNGGTCLLFFTSTAPYVAQKNIIVTGDNISEPPSLALAFSIGGYLIWSIDSANMVSVIDTKDLYPTQWGNSIVTNAQSLMNGRANTNRINNFTGFTGIGVSAAVFCYYNISGRAAPGTWYLPSICQMGGVDQGANCPAGSANIDSNLAQFGFGNLSGSYWSSTEFSTSPQNFAWVESFSKGGSRQRVESKYNNVLKVRCSRSISY